MSNRERLRELLDSLHQEDFATAGRVLNEADLDALFAASEHRELVNELRGQVATLQRRRHSNGDGPADSNRLIADLAYHLDKVSAAERGGPDHIAQDMAALPVHRSARPRKVRAWWMAAAVGAATLLLVLQRSSWCC